MIRRLLLGTAALALVATTPATASPVPRVFQLSGRTTITANGSGAVRVRIPGRAELSAIDDFRTLEQNPNHEVRISGRGRVAGFVLTKLGPRTDRLEPLATVVGLQYGMCSGRACAPVKDPVMVLEAKGDGVTSDSRTFSIPGGDYTLHVVADGAPVRIVIDFPNLPGDQRLAVPTANHTTVVEAADAGNGRYTSSGTLRLPGLGLVVGAAITRGEHYTGPGGGFCVVRAEPGSERPTDPYDAVTGCEIRNAVWFTTSGRGLVPDPDYGGGPPGHSTTNPGTYPGGGMQVLQAFSAGEYRYGQDYLLGPTEYEHTFVLLTVPMR